MNTCQRCNDPHQTDGNSCTNCGWMVGSPYTGPAYVQPQPATGDWRQKLPLILGVILSVIAVFILAAFLMFRSSSAAPATTPTLDPVALNAALTQVALTPGAPAAGLTALPLASATPAMPVECIPSLPGEVTKNIPAWCGPALTAIAASPAPQIPATVTNLPATVPANILAPAAEVCRLYKANTADENSTPANWIRVEVGGSNVQHVDAYARRGMKAVSYIVLAIASQETPDIWYMFGSVFEATDAPSCQTFDWVTDTTQYAIDRLDSGHSGIVVDLRSGTPVVVANVANLSQAVVNGILAENSRLLLDSSASASATSAGSCNMSKETHNPVVGKAWTVTGPGVVNFWSNQPGADQTEHKLLLADGETVNLLGGGTFWVAQPGCSVDADYANNSLPEISLVELQNLGLVK